jgi:AraC family transcriptional activator of pobA
MAKKLLINNKIESGKMIKVAPFKKDIRKTTPHTHNNYFEILYLSAGSGRHFIDSRAYEVKPPVMFFVRKEQVHHWELDSEPDGFVLILKKAFVDQSLDSELKVLLMEISKQSCLHIYDPVIIQALFSLLTLENAYEHEYGFQITEGLLKSLLAKVLEIAAPQMALSTRKGLYESFFELLNKGDVIKNKVAYYANLLNTSPQNLNAACRKAINQSAADVLSAHILEQAKRLLIYTDNTVSEISATLDFSDTYHFVKYLKRLAGHTPLSFRRMQ